MQRWIIVYDVADNRRRNQLAELLDSFGDRVQESVFEVLADAKCLDAIRQRAGVVIDSVHDKVRLYPVCDACAGKVVDLGRVDQQPFYNPEVIIL